MQAAHSDYTCTEGADVHIVQWHHLQTAAKLVITCLSQDVLFTCPKSGKSGVSVPLDLLCTVSEYLLLQQHCQECGFPSNKGGNYKFFLLKLRCERCCLKNKNVDEI